MSGEPAGLECPGCGERALMVFAGQAFCGNGECHVVSWRPERTLAELMDDVHVVTWLDDTWAADEEDDE